MAPKKKDICISQDHTVSGRKLLEHYLFVMGGAASDVTALLGIEDIAIPVSSGLKQARIILFSEEILISYLSEQEKTLHVFLSFFFLSHPTLLNFV